MSYIFEVGDLTVWSPALRIGDLYVRTAKSLAEWSGEESGLVAQSSDYYTIDVERFTAFLRSLVAGPLSKHDIFRELALGFIAISQAMLDRAGVPLPQSDMPGLPERTAAVKSSMPE